MTSHTSVRGTTPQDRASLPATQKIAHGRLSCGSFSSPRVSVHDEGTGLCTLAVAAACLCACFFVHLECQLLEAVFGDLRTALTGQKTGKEF